MKNILLILTLFFNLTIFSQGFKDSNGKQIKFRKDYAKFTYMVDAKWQPTENKPTKIVFNSNDNSDIVIYGLNLDKPDVYSPVGKLSIGYVEKLRYQSIKALTPNGSEVEIKLFDGDEGVYIVLQKGAVMQFHN